MVIKWKTLTLNHYYNQEYIKLGNFSENIKLYLYFHIQHSPYTKA